MYSSRPPPLESPTAQVISFFFNLPPEATVLMIRLVVKVYFSHSIDGHDIKMWYRLDLDLILF